MQRPRAWAKPAAEGGRLAEVAAEPDHPQAAVGRLQPRQHLEAVVRAAVVDEEQSRKLRPNRAECVGQLLVERGRCSATRSGSGMTIESSGDHPAARSIPYADVATCRRHVTPPRAPPDPARGRRGPGDDEARKGVTCRSRVLVDELERPARPYRTASSPARGSARRVRATIATANSKGGTADAGEQDEDLERRRRRQERRDQQRQHAVALERRHRVADAVPLNRFRRNASPPCDATA